MCDEASVDLTSIGIWFGEEKFTYIKLFGNTTDPHILPLYILDKLFAREIAYQIIVEGMSRNLKESKKQTWPSFPLRCGSFTLHDFKHAEKEAEKNKMLKLAILPKRQYDPKSVAYNFTSHVKIAKFKHEKDNYDDFFASDELFSQVKQLAKIKWGVEGLDEFYKFRTQRLHTLRLDLLNTTSMVQHEGHSEENTTEKTPEKEKTPKREKSPEKEKSP